MIHDLKMNRKKKMSWIGKRFRSLIAGRCNALKQGCMEVTDCTGKTMKFGDPRSDLLVSLEIHDPRFYRRVVTEGDLGVAQALIDGDFTCNDATNLVQLFIRNMDLTDRLEQPGARVIRQFKRIGHWLRRNTVRRSRKNIEAHYDLGNDFYSLWLDPTMNYSSGIFGSPNDTLEQASVAKMERLCQRLDLKSTDHLLEIGTGWGALACYAAEKFGCRVTTTTISQEQFTLARQRVRERGLEGLVEVINKDYRDLEGTYDKIVTVEMIEAVGHQYYQSFFEKCQSLLTPEGQMLMQAIVIADHRYESHIRNVDFISQYIFPGGSLPSITKLASTASEAGRMRVVELVDITPHYAETLRRWRENFMKQLPAVRELGYDSKFIRMWHYYLCYCEAAFEERQINTVQMMFSKQHCKNDPLTDVGEVSKTDSAVPRPQRSSTKGAVTC
jgi:cyclopropane-fatty-acyl-phospholipid synthase